ncbi:hypothetical protein LTR35_002738 [Friedmanniomyces endolithicus]|uniref:Uncharacterized protein n=1 Tax=Friedmanniomyces endolithicus TaxID=329885 RepID=A0AAN6JGA7_9PEZI|nr:hypothetical protein LTS00_010003 [Friedmanniomyces endolithicus]KAK0289541.1 hypothetical protein LTR35_002738 [Friedmanniomyces endolithicus]KAK0328686.1 hypothetical protein LTR82_000618 [Friedmanniomyces endolithicus]KAK1019620.1 hypothetical protein LTR54_000262 [Friedmanniomyces endolithicus]
MGGKDQDDDEEHDGGLTASVLQQMQAGHDNYLRQLHEERRRFPQAMERETDPSPGGNSVFLSLKNFIDTNLDNLVDSFRQFPANIAELRTKMHDESKRRKQEELNVWQRWTGLEESPDHVQMLRDRASPVDRQEAVDAAVMLLREARHRNAHVPAEKIEALFKDETIGSLDAFASPMLSPGGACYYQQDSGYNAPSTAIFRSSSSSYRWLSIDWFKCSPYSPVSLEQLDELQEPGGSWRGAFEDLLSAALDKPMNSREQFGRRCPVGSVQSTRTGPGLDWCLSLQCRGILPPQLPLWYNSSRSGRLAPTDDLFKEQARSVFSSNDINQLVEEIATPAPPKVNLSGPDLCPSDLSLPDKKENALHSSMQACGNPSVTAEDGACTAPNPGLQRQQPQLESCRQRNQTGRQEEFQRQQERDRLHQSRMLPDDDEDQDTDDTDDITELGYYERTLQPMMKRALQDSQRNDDRSGLTTDSPSRSAPNARCSASRPSRDNAEDLAVVEAAIYSVVQASLRSLFGHDTAHDAVTDLLNKYNKDHVEAPQSPSFESSPLNGTHAFGNRPPAATLADKKFAPTDAEDWARASGLSLEESQRLFEYLYQQRQQRGYERRDLVRRGLQAAGMEESELVLLPINELRTLVEGLEQQREALGLDNMAPADVCPAAMKAISLGKVAGEGQDNVVGDGKSSKVDVLSSLTTTHTTRLPDGTITTKVLLKQRFADGREESEEKVHTYREESTGRQQRPETEKRRGGWFWS